MVTFPDSFLFGVFFPFHLAVIREATFSAWRPASAVFCVSQWGGQPRLPSNPQWTFSYSFQFLPYDEQSIPHCTACPLNVKKNNSFSEIEFMYHAVHLWKKYNSVVFSIIYSQICKTITTVNLQTFFNTSKRNPVPFTNPIPIFLLWTELCPHKKFILKS